MKVIGFSSGTVGRPGNVDRMVRVILEKSGHQPEFVKLTDLVFSGCKGCSWLCAGPQVCQLEDDLKPYYQKIKEADALVVGCAVHGGNPDAMILSFLERFYGYRHVVSTLQNKPVIGVVCGYRRTEAAAEQLRGKLRNQNLLALVEYQSSSPPCLRCGRHRECRLGALYRMCGEAVRTMTITDESFHQWEDDPDVVMAIEEAAAKLKSILDQSESDKIIAA